MPSTIVYGKAINLSNYNWDEAQLKKFQTEFETILSFLNKPIDQDNFQELFNSCFKIVANIPLPLINVDANFIIRARPNYYGEVFKDEWQVSYNSKNIEKIKLNRFNRPTESMFYAAAPGVDQGRFVATATLECAKRF